MLQQAPLPPLPRTTIIRPIPILDLSQISTSTSPRQNLHPGAFNFFPNIRESGSPRSESSADTTRTSFQSLSTKITEDRMGTPSLTPPSSPAIPIAANLDEEPHNNSSSSDFSDENPGASTPTTTLRLFTPDRHHQISSPQPNPSVQTSTPNPTASAPTST
ncbi:MAG: hypothetical protein WCW01_02005 [Gammaproteobacteria bacterium]|jgi:hypothetical protein